MRAPDMTGNGGAFASMANDFDGRNQEENLTGRQTLVFREGATQEGIEFLRRSGFRVFVSNASDPEVTREDQLEDSDCIVLPTLGVAFVGGDPEQMSMLQNMASDVDGPILTIEPEKVREMLEVTPGTDGSTPDDMMISLGYLRGRRDAYAELVAKVGSNGRTQVETSTPPWVSRLNESQSTWGLQATKAADSPLFGRGVKVAVLDTGIDFTVNENGQREYHPDFEGRTIVTESFVRNVASPKDGNGHGTHCIGTACGPRRPSTLPGYGVASDAAIYVGKVLNDAGAGADLWITAGIEWAINQGCRIVSLSLGSRKKPGDTFNTAYEEIAQRAQKAGTLIVAAAGNHSARPSQLRPVSGPADCPSIMAVAAVDSDLQVAVFSNAGVNGNAGAVNIAAPGVDVYSSYLRPPGHKRLPGTSMATPHVAGIAALFAEANPKASAVELWDMLTQAAQDLGLSPRDVGKGLVQAPQNGWPAANPQNTDSDAGFRSDELAVTIQQSSPITIGGGGSVGVGFDLSHYIRVPSAPGQRTKFENRVNDQLLKLRIIDKFGDAPDRTPSDVNCRIVVHCEDFDDQGNVKPNSDSPVTIHGNPLAVEIKVEDYSYGTPIGGTREMFYSATRRITGAVDIFEGTATTPTIQYPVPTGGKCTVDVLNRL